MHPCALCGAAAFLYCEADLAFLCWTCDAAVHGANFLVARHVRLVACRACRSVDVGRRVSGVGFPPVTSPCRSCRRRSLSPPAAEPCSPASSASSASSCLTAESSATAPPPAARRRDSRRVRTACLALESLCGRMGMRGRPRLAAEAAQAIDAIGAFREMVALAAVVWHAMKMLARREKRTARSSVEDALQRLAACSRVPPRLIVAAESKLARAKARR